MDNSFIEREYQECFNQLRYYDTRQETIAKYLITLTSSVAAIQLALLSFLPFPEKGLLFYANLFGYPERVLFFAAQSFLSLLVFIGSVILFSMAIQNRLYFVFIVRQINAIRKYMLATQSPGFTNNQLYTSTSFSAFKLFSVHTLQIIGASIVSSLFAGITIFEISQTLNWPFALGISILAFCCVGAIEIIGGAIYLRSKSKESADKAIHHE
jgi:hypothetical protein